MKPRFLIRTPAVRVLLSVFLLLVFRAYGNTAVADTNLLVELMAPQRVHVRNVATIRVQAEPRVSGPFRILPKRQDIWQDTGECIHGPRILYLVARAEPAFSSRPNFWTFWR